MRAGRQTGAFLAWLSVALFFLYQYILRISPGVMIHEIRADFGMTAQQFSLLGAFYLYGYAFFQIPLGLVMDRIGVRKLVMTGLLLCMMGAVSLGVAQDSGPAHMSRIFVGIGSGTAFMGSMKLITDSFAPGRRGFFMGVTLTIGLLGALIIGKPLVYGQDMLGWRGTVLLTAAAGLVILMLISIFVPRHHPAYLPKMKIGAEIVRIFKHRPIMMYSLCTIGLYAPVSTLADLWGTAFLMQKYNLAQAEAAQTSMMMYGGMALGCLIIPWVCERYHQLNLGIQVAMGGMFVTFSLILYGPIASMSGLTGLLIAVGFFCGAEMACFAGALQQTTAINSGLIIGVVNTINTLGGGILQQGVGRILDFIWRGGVTESGSRAYDADEFVAALSLFLLIIGGCCLISLKLDPRKGLSVPA